MNNKRYLQQFAIGLMLCVASLVATVNFDGEFAALGAVIAYAAMLYATKNITQYGLLLDDAQRVRYTLIRFIADGMVCAVVLAILIDGLRTMSIQWKCGGALLVLCMAMGAWSWFKEYRTGRAKLHASSDHRDR